MSNSTYTIRVQGKSVTGPGLQSVITYFKEVPLPSIGSFAPTFDVSNVQVLKGPKGTLFGRNTTGGAVLVYSALPTYVLEGYAEVAVGNFNKREFQGAINIPIIDDVLSLRLGDGFDILHGLQKHMGPGGDPDDVQ